MNYRKIFKTWMKENGYWKAFKETKGNSYFNLSKSLKPENYISSTFYWYKQKEESKYWSTASFEWTQYLKSTKEKKMNKNKQIEEIENTIKELQSQVEGLKKPVRWRAEEGERYWYGSSEGCVKSLTELRAEFDNKIYNTGNYFQTKEEAEQSIFYILLNSEYEYWIAGVSELPETMPEGVEECSNNGWSKSDKRVYNWGIRNRRWPKKQSKL